MYLDIGMVISTPELLLTHNRINGKQFRILVRSVQLLAIFPNVILKEM